MSPAFAVELHMRRLSRSTVRDVPRDEREQIPCRAADMGWRRETDPLAAGDGVSVAHLSMPMSAIGCRLNWSTQHRR